MMVRMNSNPVPLPPRPARPIAEQRPIGGRLCLDFVNTLEETCVDVIENGTMTKDLAAAIHGTTQPPSGSFVTTGEFLTAVEMQLKGVYTR